MVTYEESHLKATINSLDLFCVHQWGSYAIENYFIRSLLKVYGYTIRIISALALCFEFEM